MENMQILVKELPEGALTVEHFEQADAPMPAPKSGELLVRVILMSIDAANRAWMQGATYRAPVLAGEAMHTYAICEVMESRSDAFHAGDIVAAETIWAKYAVVNARAAVKLPELKPLSRHLSVFGIAGKTAFHGLVSVGRPIAGETIVVSAAAGSVGSLVGQIGKALGCRVVGIAGGDEKCGWVVQELGFDACLNYREKGWQKGLRGAAPDGVDVYFDNVGGGILESVLFAMNERGRVVCCGAVSQYDATSPTGPRNLPGLVVVKRLRMEGFIVMDFAHQDAAALRALKTWADAGALTVPEDITEGLASAPAALVGLLGGDNRGKRMVRVGPDP